MTVSLVRVLSSTGVSAAPGSPSVGAGSAIAVNPGALETAFVWVLRYRGVQLVAMETGLEGAGESLESVAFLGVLAIFEVFFLRGLPVRLKKQPDREELWWTLYSMYIQQHSKQLHTSSYIAKQWWPKSLYSH